MAVKSGAAVDRQAAFDVTVNELEYRPPHAGARELAEASVTDGDGTRPASAVRAFLDACGYEPGFEQEPERLAPLERALDVVRADMRATRGGRAGSFLPMPPTTFPRSLPSLSKLARQSWSPAAFGRSPSSGGRVRWLAAWPASQHR